MALNVLRTVFTVSAILIACYQLFTQTFEIQGYLWLCLALTFLIIGIQALKQKRNIYAGIQFLVFILALVVAIIEFLGL